MGKHDDWADEHFPEIGNTLTGLPPTQGKVFLLIAAGLGRKRIAMRLGCSLSCVQGTQLRLKSKGVIERIGPRQCHGFRLTEAGRELLEKGDGRRRTTA